MPMPKFLLIGAQSAGKSTISELLAGFPINVCKSGVGTRRPLSVVLEYDAQVKPGEAVCTIDGKSIPQDRVSHRVEELNEELGPKPGAPKGDEGSFDNKYIQLHIKSCEVMNMVFVDPPGLRVDGSPVQRMIEKILTLELQDPDNMVVAVLNTGDYGNERAISFLREVKGDKWVETPGNIIFLMPKFDLVTTVTDFGRNANNSLDAFAARSWLKPIHLITRARDVDVGASFAVKRQHLQDIPEHEKKTLKEWIAKMAKNNTDEPSSRFREADFLPRLGWDKAKAIFQLSLSDAIKRTLPGNLQTLFAIRDSTVDKILALKGIMQASSPSKLRSDLCGFVIALCKEIRACMDGDVKAANLLKLQAIGETAPIETQKYKADSLFPNISFKRQILDKQLEKQFFDFYEQAVADPDPDAHLNRDSRLFGGKQYQRMKFYFWRALERAINTDLSEHQIVNVMGALNQNSSEEDAIGASVKLTSLCVERSIHAGINYLLRRTGYLLFRLAQIAIWVLELDQAWRPVVSRFVPEPRERFLQKLMTACGQFLKTHIQQADIHCSDDAQASYDTISGDLKHFPLVRDILEFSRGKKDSQSALFASLAAKYKEQWKQNLLKVVISQVDMLMCLNKVNLNNSVNCLVYMKYRDGLEGHLMDIVNKMTNDEVLELFGAGGATLEKEMQRLEGRKRALEEIITQYAQFQDLVNTL